MTAISRVFGLPLIFVTGALSAAAASPSEQESSGNSAAAHAQWIAPPPTGDPLHSLPLFRKEFNVATRPTRATLRITGLGDYEARVNGHRVSATGINQPWSQ